MADIDDKVWRGLLATLEELSGLGVNTGVVASKGGDEPHDEGGITLIELMAIHEFGSEAAGIPERAPIRTTFVQKEQEIGAFAGKLANAIIEKGMPVEQALNLLGMMTSTEVKKTITTGEHLPPPLAPSTIARKGSDRPLVDTGRLVNSISWEVVPVGGDDA